MTACLIRSSVVTEGDFPLLAANRFLAHVLFALVLVWLFACLALTGCQRPPPPPAPANHLFSPSPPGAFDDDLRRYETRVTIDNSGQIRGATGDLVIVRITTISETETLKQVQTAIRLAQARNAPMLVILDGTGGRVLAGLQVASELAHSGLEVRCQVRNIAMSMNAFLFETVECTRSMYETADLMFHHPHIDVLPTDTEADVQRKAEAEERLLGVLCLGIHARTNGRVTQEECQDHLHENKTGTWTVNAMQALALGLVDFVVKPPGAK